MSQPPVPVEITVALITGLCSLFGVIVTAILSYINNIRSKNSKKIIDEINDAVNRRHEKRGPSAPKLYDLIWENHQKADELIQWKRGYDGGPLDNGQKAEDFYQETTSRLSAIEQSIKEINFRPPCTHPDFMKQNEQNS